MQPSAHGLSALLERWQGGDAGALDALMPMVYEAMREAAHDRRRGERSELSLNTTALVHETYLKLSELRQPQFHDRAHFLAMASRVMSALWS